MLSVFVPQVENDFIGQYYDYDCEMKHFEDPAWGINLRDISWFRYSFEPLYNFRPGDGLPSNHQVICPAFRTAHPPNVFENVSEFVDKSQSFIISPNPFTGNLKIVFKGNENSEIDDVAIYNMLGKNITNSFVIEVDSKHITIKPGAIIAPAVFICRFSKNGKVSTVKLFKAGY